MTRSRTVLLGLCIVLLGVAGAGIYLYRHLPELLRLQVERTLRHYGVDDIEYEGLRFSHREASIDTLVLHGRYENLAYQARMTRGALHYDWRALLTGKVDSLSLSSVEISVAQTAASVSRDTTIISVEEFLPRQLVARLPLQSLRIDKWRADYRSPADRTIAAHGSLVIDRHIDLRLRAMHATCELAAELQGDTHAPDVQLELSLTGAQTSAATVSAQLARGAGNDWEWHLQGRAQYTPLLSCLHALELAPGIPAQTGLAIDGESVFTASIRHPDTLNLAAAPDAGDAPLRQLKAGIHLTNEIRRLDIPTLVDGLNGTLTLDVTVADARIDSTLQPFSLTGNFSTQRLSLPEGWPRWMGWGETVPVHLETAEPLAASSDGNGWSVLSRNTVFSLGDDDTGLRFEKLNLDVIAVDAGPVHTSMQLGASLNTHLRKQILPRLDVAFTQRGTAEQSDVTLHLTDTVKSIRAGLAGTLNPATGSGTHQLTVHIDDLPYFTATITPLLQHFDLLKDSVTIRSGTVELTTTLTSKDFAVENWQQQSRLSANNVSGNVNDHAFDGLALAANWSGMTQWQTLQPLTMSVTTLNPGFAVKDFQLQLSLPKATPIAQPRVRIDAFSARVFGGQLTLPDAQAWDFAAPSNQVTLTAQSWQLGELVALQQNADIQAEGTLEGELPITVAGGRMIIDNGYLRALPPGGSIRYRANDETRVLAGSNPELALALDLLSDLQYEVLSGAVQLDKAGNLLLALSLTGSNPAQFSGQVIQFNINVEQNLDPLLQSLRIGDNLEQRIEEKLK